MAGLFLGIDIGTGGVRACVVDSQGDIRGIASAALPPPRQDGDLIDQDPELWWQAAVTAILKLGQTVDLAGVERIAVDGTSGTLCSSMPPANRVHWVSCITTPAQRWNPRGSQKWRQRKVAPTVAAVRRPNCFIS